MQHLKISLLFLLLFSSAGCINNKEKQNQTGQLNYDQAVESAKQNLRDAGYYEDDETVFMYDPKCSFWHLRYSGSPELLTEALKAYGLTNKNYYAISFIGKTAYTRDGGATVFVDKDEKQVIGVLYDGGRFVENSAK